MTANDQSSGGGAVHALRIGRTEIVCGESDER